MKTLLIIGILLVGLSGQALSMGHPHNMFAARKHMQAKASMSVAKARPSVSSVWQPTVQLPKTTLSEYLLLALAQLHPARD